MACRGFKADESCFDGFEINGLLRLIILPFTRCNPVKHLAIAAGIEGVGCDDAIGARRSRQIGQPVEMVGTLEFQCDRLGKFITQIMFRVPNAFGHTIHHIHRIPSALK